MFDASRPGAWTGSTSGGSAHAHALSGNTGYNGDGSSQENTVLSKMMVPIIKA